MVIPPAFLCIGALGMLASHSVLAQCKDPGFVLEETGEVTHVGSSAPHGQGRVAALARDSWTLGRTTAGCLSNRSLVLPFFWGPIFRTVPHVRASQPLGHLCFTPKETDTFVRAAHQTPNGLATYWAGPFPMLYTASNQARRELVRESHVGVVNQASAEYLDGLTGGNQVLATFPAFRALDSATYKAQRRFLLARFHGGAKHRLPEIAETAGAFLRQYAEERGQFPRPLRELVTGLVLHTSSHLLGLTQVTLDGPYFERPEFRHAIGRVARYGISERADPAFESTLHDLFMETFASNFEPISGETAKTSLIRNLFDSMDQPFPRTFEEFTRYPGPVRHAIAMNFASTGLGGMVHSTANTLDWAIARLLAEPSQMDRLAQLMAEHQRLDLTGEGVFDKDGPLFPLAEWVLHNVFLYPPFSHQFFLNQQSFTATLADGSKVEVPSMSFTVVNYAECNRSEERMASADTFSEALLCPGTVGKFIMDPRVASFGGSKISKDNPNSRLCPGAKTSLYEQMIMLGILLRDYSLQMTDSKELSCAADPKEHPLCSRVNRGQVVLARRQQGSLDVPMR